MKAGCTVPVTGDHIQRGKIIIQTVCGKYLYYLHYWSAYRSIKKNSNIHWTNTLPQNSGAIWQPEASCFHTNLSIPICKPPIFTIKVVFKI